jgi:hypothetical protein
LFGDNGWPVLLPLSTNTAWSTLNNGFIACWSRTTTLR